MPNMLNLQHKQGDPNDKNQNQLDAPENQKMILEFTKSRKYSTKTANSSKRSFQAMKRTAN